MQFTVLCMNLRSETELSAKYLFDQVIPYMKNNNLLGMEEDIDFFLLQETNVGDGLNAPVASRLKKERYGVKKVCERLDGNGDNYLFAASSKWEITKEGKIPESPLEGLTRSETKVAAYLTVKCEDTEVRLYNFHNRPEKGQRNIINMSAVVDKIDTDLENCKNAIFAGDFNLLINDVVDYFEKFKIGVANRFDYIMYSSEFKRIAGEIFDQNEDGKPYPEVTTQESGSDHCAIFCRFETI